MPPEPSDSNKLVLVVAAHVVHIKVKIFISTFISIFTAFGRMRCFYCNNFQLR